MAAAVTVTAAQLITRIRYELYDNNSTQYSDPELLAYINKSLEMIHEILVENRSELVRTGTGTITTVAGTPNYDLSANGMGDLWISHRVWVTGEELMEMIEEYDLYDSINAEEDGSTGHRSEPDEYCLIGEYIWFEETPDAIYTINLRYFPNFVPLAATTENMPLKNLFNQSIIEGSKVLAKHRNNFDIQIDAILKDIFQEQAMKIMRRRRIRPISIVPKMR
jgi:hypothetical protein